MKREAQGEQGGAERGGGAGGEQGGEKVLSVLAADVDRTLALLGEEKFSNVTEHYLYR